MKLEIAISFPSMGKVHLPDPASLLSLDHFNLLWPIWSTLIASNSANWLQQTATNNKRRLSYLVTAKNKNGLLRHQKEI
jgi:hypothetical protein